MKAFNKPQAFHAWCLALLALLLTPLSVMAENSDSFPLRKVYPDTSTISLKKLQERFDHYVVVDVRAPSEFEVMHIKGALNIPASSLNFHEQIRQLAEKHGGKSFVFYCSGPTCPRSFEAEVKARQKARITNIYVFDGGLFGWVDANPRLTIVLGKEADTSMLISPAKFKAHVLPPKEFIERANQSSGKIVDVRDTNEKDGISLFSPTREINAGFNKPRIQEVVKDAIQRGQPVFFYDHVGLRIKLLQYILEDEGLKDYYFMEGGMDGYIKVLQDKK